MNNQAKKFRFLLVVCLSCVICLGCMSNEQNSQNESNEPNGQNNQNELNEPKELIELEELIEPEVPTSTSIDSVSTGTESSEPSSETEDESASLYDMRKYVRNYLTERDVSSELTEGILKYQEGDFYLWYEFDKEELNRRLNLILRVVDDPQLSRELEKFPELTNLFVGVIVSSDRDGVQNLLASVRNLSSSEQCDIYGLFATQAAPEEACRLAKLLRESKYRDRILRLWRHSPANIELLQFFHYAMEERKISSQSASAYEEWLFQIVDRHLRASEGDPREHDAWYMLAILSDSLRENLRDNEFRSRFQSEIWPAVIRILDKMAEVPDEIVYDPEGRSITYEDRSQIFLFNLSNSWEFFKVFPDTGVELFEKVGVNASFVLMDPAFYDSQKPNDTEQKSARNRLAYMMLYGRESSAEKINVPYAILCIPPSTFTSLRRFLNKEGLSDEALQVGLSDLGNSSDERTVFDKLSYWNSLRTNVLMKEEPFCSMTVNPASWIPGYDLCACIGKACDGRRVSGGDILFAAMDGAFIAVDIATMGGSMAIRQTGKTGAKVATKSLSHKAAQELAKAGVKSGEKMTAKTLEKCSSETVSELLKNSRATLREAFKTNADITGYTRSFFTHSKLGREAFKKLTGLEARIFMREDRKVIILMKWGNMADNVVSDCGVNAALDLASRSEVGQEAIATVIAKYKKISDELSDEDNWKVNLSSWWGICQE